MERKFKKVCLDTDILIDYLRKKSYAKELILKLCEMVDVYTTSITSFEIWFGEEFVERKAIANELFDLLKVLPLDDPAARIAAKKHAFLLKNNIDLGIKDMMIAGISIYNKIPLVTTNIKHFEKVPGIEVLHPKEAINLISIS